MSRVQRSARKASFVESVDFNQQMYEALRSAPWWMISIAFHVLVVVVSSIVQTGEVRVAPAPAMTALMGPTEAAIEREAPEVDEPTEPLVPSDVVSEKPVITDAPLSDHDETDNDVPTNEMLGRDDGTSDSPYDGLANNSLIGVGPGAGSPFGRRGGNENLRKGGGGKPKPIDDALEDALRWLAAHQSPDGGWACETWTQWCDRKPSAAADALEGAGKAGNDVGVTGLSLLAFLGAGYTNRSKGLFGEVVGNGLKYLRNVQDAEGCFGSRASGHYVYNHAIASLAMVEAYGMTGSPVFRNPTQKALDFIAITRNPYYAWRYGVKPGDNDTSVTGWMMMALKSAKLINASDVKLGKAPTLTYDEEAFDGIRAWVEKMTDPDTGRVGYQQRGTGPARPQELSDRFPAEKSESMTAVGMLARIFLGENPKTSEPIRKGAELCARLVPVWNVEDGSIDMYYWYYATLAMFQVGGEPWKKWETAMKSGIVDRQRRDGDFCAYRGSWDPLDPWGPDGGRVYSTACMALCLEVWSRYPRVFGLGAPK